MLRETVCRGSKEKELVDGGCDRIQPICFEIGKPVLSGQYPNKQQSLSLAKNSSMVLQEQSHFPEFNSFFLLKTIRRKPDFT